MLPLVTALMQQGLSILGGAVLAKGQAVVEDKLGIKFPSTITPAEALELKKVEFQHEEWLINAAMQQRGQELDFQKVQETTVAERWKADMASDSWLSKNIRPSVLIYLLSAYTLLAVLSACNLNVAEAYIILLKQWGELVLTAYFGGRSLEKIISIVQKRKGA